MLKYVSSYIEVHKEIIASILLGLLTVSFMFTFSHLTDVVLVCTILLTGILYKRDSSIKYIYKLLWHEGRIFFCLLGIVGVAYMISTAFTGWHRESLTAVRKTIQWVLYPVVLTFILGSISNRTECVIKNVLSGSLFIMFCDLLYQALVLHIPRPDEWISGYYCNISSGIIASLLFLFFTKKFASNTNYKALMIIILLGSVATLGVLESRGALMGLLAASICMCIYGGYCRLRRKPQSISLICYVILGIGIITMLCLPLVSTQTNLKVRTENALISMKELFAAQTSSQISDEVAIRGGGDRVFLLHSTMHMIEDHPVFGVGLSQFNAVYTQQGYILPQAREPQLKSPHNIFLHILVETGVVGFIPFILLWLYMLYYVVQAVRSNTPYAIAVLLGFIVILVHGMVDYVFLHRGPNQITFLLLSFVILSKAQQQYK